MTKLSISVNGLINTIFLDFVITHKLSDFRRLFFLRTTQHQVYKKHRSVLFLEVCLNMFYIYPLSAHFSYIKNKVAHPIFEKSHLIRLESQTIISFKNFFLP